VRLESCLEREVAFNATVACGLVHVTVALALPVQLARHEALAMQSRVPVHLGGLASAEHVPWHSPMQVAIAGM